MSYNKLKLYDLDKCPADRLSYPDVTLFLFCIGTNWRIPTRRERQELMQMTSGELARQLDMAWDTDDLLRLTQLRYSDSRYYLFPVRA